MKRVLLIGFILAICILAFPQGVAADPAGSAVITAKVDDYLVCGATGGATDWALTHVPQDNQLPNWLHTTLTSSLPWKYYVGGSNGGKLQAYSGGYLGTPTLTNQLYIDGLAVPGVATPSELASGAEIIGWTGTYSYNQNVAIDDKANSFYRIDLTFTCTQGA